MKIKITRLNCSGTKLENCLLFIKTRELVFTLHVWKKNPYNDNAMGGGGGGGGEFKNFFRKQLPISNQLLIKPLHH